MCAAQRESNGDKLDVDNCSAQLLPGNQEKLLSTVYCWATVPPAIKSEVVYLWLRLDTLLRSINRYQR